MGQYLYYIMFIPQIIALIHYFRNRPEGYWFWIILFFGPIGAIVYLFAVVLSNEGAVSVQGRVRAGLKERKRSVQLEVKIKAKEALPYDFFELGEIQFKFKKYDSAAENFKISAEKSPENKDAQYMLGLCLEKLDRYQEAGKYLESLVMENPKFKFGEAMHALARCYRGAGEIDTAIGAYKRVLSQNNFAQARYALAELLIQKGHKDDARTQLERLITDTKTADVPSYQKREEKRWARKAKTLLLSL